MFYRPQQSDTGRMWDTWLYWHEGVYYLYCLANAGPAWDNMSLATSSDGVHWQERGAVLKKDPEIGWMGTGSTWASPDFARDGRFFMNFSYSKGGQRICMAESTDLVHWRPMGPAYCTRPDTRWYKTAEDDSARWDCIFTCPRDEGGLWGYWTASPAAHHGVGFGRSLDGCTWEALKPPAIEPALEAPCEHGGVARVGNRYYHMLGVNGSMVAYAADGPGGPLRRQGKNAGLLTNEGWGKLYTYFARFFHSPSGLLVNHHSIGRRTPQTGPLDRDVYLGLLKRAVFDAEGTMRLGWWEGNDALKAAPAAVTTPPAGPDLRMVREPLPADAGTILEGRITLPAGPTAPRPGLLLKLADGAAACILVGERGVTELGAAAADGSGFAAESRVDREFPFGPAVRFRLSLERDLLEFYLDELLIQCFSLPSAATGAFGVIGDVTGLAAWSSQSR